MSLKLYIGSWPSVQIEQIASNNNSFCQSLLDLIGKMKMKNSSIPFLKSLPTKTHSFTCFCFLKIPLLYQYIQMYPKVTNSIAGVDHLTIIKIFMYCSVVQKEGKVHHQNRANYNLSSFDLPCLQEQLLFRLWSEWFSL